MSAWIIDFTKRKENILPAARGDTEWRGAVWSLPWWWIIGIWGGSLFLWGGQVGEQSALRGSTRFSPNFVLPFAIASTGEGGRSSDDNNGGEGTAASSPRPVVLGGGGGHLS